MPADRIHIISDRELEITPRKGWFVFARLTAVPLLLFVAIAPVFFVDMILKSAELKFVFIGLLLALVFLALTALIFYKIIYKPFYIVNTKKYILKKGEQLQVGSKLYTLNRETSGIYMGFEETLRSSGYYTVGLRIRAPYKIKHYPILTCKREEMEAYGKVLADFAGLELEYTLFG
ncbi:MAG: hypothetical protein R2800_14170 [Flavipsychrobacter sp.]